MTFRKESETSRNFCRSGNLGLGGWEAVLGNPQARAHICCSHGNISRRDENICHQYENIFVKNGNNHKRIQSEIHHALHPPPQILLKCRSLEVYHLVGGPSCLLTLSFAPFGRS